jgi:hypothetical protein
LAKAYLERIDNVLEVKKNLLGCLAKPARLINDISHQTDIECTDINFSWHR